MGEVYKAFDPGLDRTVALKTIRPDGDNPTFLDRLYREAKACGRLHHPGIVTVYDIGEANGTVFIAMEYLEGDNLGAAIEAARLSFEQKVKTLIEILDALEYAHGEGVVHRDIKPSNIHLLPNGKVKLLDFGLARVARADSLTMTGAVMGTPYYMSPEQLNGLKVDGRSDIFSTGVLAYELFTHRRAFDGDSITTVMLKVLNHTPAPMATAWSATFPDVEKIVARAMAKNVEDRYSTAGDMRNALSAFLAASHTAISKTQADVTIQTQRAVFEAQTLLQQGQAKQSEALLAETIRMNPEAKDARALLQQATLVTQPPAAQPPAPPAPPNSAAEPTAAQPTTQLPQKPPAKPAADPKSTTVNPRAPQPAAHGTALADTMPLQQNANAAANAAKKSSRGALAGFAVALVAIIGVTAYVVQQRSTPTPTTPTSAAEAPAASPATAAAPQTAATPATPPVTTTPASGSTAVAPQQTQAAGSVTPARGAQGAGPIPAPARAANSRSAVQVEAAAGADAALATALTEALKSRDVAVQSGAAGARLIVRAQSQISVRPSPLGGSALTADYTGTLQVRDAAGNSPRTLSFDGHAMDFGEPVVRQAAIRALADQMADAIKNALHN